MRSTPLRLRSLSLAMALCLLAALGCLFGQPAHAATGRAYSTSCLVGRWHVSDYITYMKAIFPKTELRFQGVSGDQAIAFNRGGHAIETASHFTIHAIDTQTHLTWTTELDGVSGGDWNTPRKRVVEFSGVEADYTETITVGSQSSSHPSIGLISTGRHRVACGKKTLRFFPHPKLPPIVLTRLSR